MDTNANTLGRLLSRLILDGHLTEDAVRGVTVNVARTLAPGIAAAAANPGPGGREAIAPYMEAASDLPQHLTPERWADFWLGYYQSRSGGREAMTAQEMGRRGGSATSEAKRAAAVVNARKGGWPKGRPRKPAA